MNVWKSFERLLPGRLRSRREMPAAEYIPALAQVTEENPVWRAVLEFGRYKFAQRAAIVSDRAQPEALRFEAMRSALDLAAFLEELEDERARAQSEFAKFQQQQGK